MTHHDARQLLLCITGEGGTGKTQIPKAIEVALGFLGRKHELILTAPTGAAADNLGGNTYHTSLGINLSYNAAVAARVRKLWAWKTILVIRSRTSELPAVFGRP
jgi:hypothetical protein